MIKHIEAIEKFNKDRGLLDKGFNHNLENSFLLSEELETLNAESIGLQLFKCGGMHHDRLAKIIISKHKKEFGSLEEEKIEYIDKVIDHFYFGIGGMLKIGLSPSQIEYLFECVEYANANKPKKSVDGKVVKDENFSDPKEEIRKVVRSLNVRK
jgi:predicted HAD superfamily Cof-like phosphohydrolase